MKNIEIKNYCKYCGRETGGFCCRSCWNTFEADGCYGDEEEDYDDEDYDDEE